MSIVDVFRLTDLNLPPFSYSLAWYLLLGFCRGLDGVVGPAVLRPHLRVRRADSVDGRCAAQETEGRCPAGDRAHGDLDQIRPAWRVVLYYVVTKDLARPVRYVEPFWMFSLFGTTPMWIGLGVLLTATVFVRNLYCRFLCPVGAALGIISNLTVFKIKRWSECKTCKICEKTCEWGAIQGPKIIKAECVRCDDCERLYLDQQKCPHWIILRRKGAKLFVSS